MNRVVFAQFLLEANTFAPGRTTIEDFEVAGFLVGEDRARDRLPDADELGAAWDSLSGGRGSIQGTLLAVLVVGVLANSLTQLRVPSFGIEMAQGALLLGAVTFDQIRIRISGEETAT